MGIIPFTISMSLFDSISTTQQIIIFILLLTTLQPLRNALSYLVGLTDENFGTIFTYGPYSDDWLVTDKVPIRGFKKTENTHERREPAPQSAQC